MRKEIFAPVYNDIPYLEMKQKNLNYIFHMIRESKCFSGGRASQNNTITQNRQKFFGNLNTIIRKCDRQRNIKI